MRKRQEFATNYQIRRGCIEIEYRPGETQDYFQILVGCHHPVTCCRKCTFSFEEDLLKDIKTACQQAFSKLGLLACTHETNEIEGHDNVVITAEEQRIDRQHWWSGSGSTEEESEKDAELAGRRAAAMYVLEQSASLSQAPKTD